MVLLARPGSYGVAKDSRCGTYGPEALEDIEVDIVLGDLLEDGRDRGRGAQTVNGRVARKKISSQSNLSPRRVRCVLDRGELTELRTPSRAVPTMSEQKQGNKGKDPQMKASE